MKILNKVKDFLIEYFDFIWHTLSTSTRSFKEDLQNRSIFYVVFNFYGMLLLHVVVIGLSTVFVIFTIDLLIRYTLTCIIVLCIFFTPALLFWWLKNRMK